MPLPPLVLYVVHIPCSHCFGCSFSFSYGRNSFQTRHTHYHTNIDWHKNINVYIFRYLNFAPDGFPNDPFSATFQGNDVIFNIFWSWTVCRKWTERKDWENHGLVNQSSCFTVDVKYLTFLRRFTLVDAFFRDERKWSFIERVFVSFIYILMSV